MSGVTTLAAAESGKLHKSLGRLDIIFLTVAATISVDTIGQVAAGGGAEAFTWAVVLGVTFLVPYALVMAELGSSFPQEGGPYVWVRLAFGRLPAAIATLFYWITNPVWLGGSLAFIAAETCDAYLFSVPPGGAVDYLVKLAFIWVSIGFAVASIAYGKWLLTAGAIAKMLLVAVFGVTVVVYAAEHGVHGAAAGDFAPTTGGFLASVPLLLFALVGFEAQNGAAEEMRDPKRDVPVSVATSGTISILCYLVPIFGIIAVIPAENITGIGGFLGAIAEVFSVYGGAADALVTTVAAVFVFVLLTQGTAWMIASDRVQAVAGTDAAFPRTFGVFHEKLGTPVRVNLLSGVVATAFMLVAMQLTDGDGAAVFAVVLTIAITTLLLSYLLIFPTVLRLRTRYADVERPYRVPGGKAGLYVAFGLIYAWIALGSFVAVFPGTLEQLFGVDYDFAETWGMSRLRFEAFTLGTLAAFVLFAVGGYRWARRDREAAAHHAVPESAAAEASPA